MEHQTVEQGSKMVDDFGAWMAERVVEAQQTHFEASKVTIE